MTRAGCELDRQIVQTLADASRSCRRGLGPPRRALALDVTLLAALPADPEPWTARGPLCPRNVVLVSSSWLLREIEVTSVRACQCPAFGGNLAGPEVSSEGGCTACLPRPRLQAGGRDVVPGLVHSRVPPAGISGSRGGRALAAAGRRRSSILVFVLGFFSIFLSSGCADCRRTCGAGRRREPQGGSPNTRFRVGR